MVANVCVCVCVCVCVKYQLLGVIKVLMGEAGG